MKTKTVVFGGGCFWCTEAIFHEINGIISVEPGYAGGNLADPTYDQVCSGTTGHIEVTKIEYDPDLIKFKDLLKVFFGTHDPTTLDKQGNDVGSQYNSAIFYTTDEQKKESEKAIKDLKDSGIEVVTQVRPLEKFYKAEDYHKNYYLKHKDQPYCLAVIDPKLKKLRNEFGEFLKESKK